MNSFLDPQFWDTYRRLPESVREQARQAYTLFRQNPNHPSLRFRRVHSSRPIYSARVGMDYRVVGIRERSDIYWFWIGSHAEYDALLKQI